MKTIFSRRTNFKTELSCNGLNNKLNENILDVDFISNPYKGEKAFIGKVKQESFYLRRKINLNNLYKFMFIFGKIKRDNTIELLFVTNPFLWIMPLFSLFILISTIYYSLFIWEEKITILGIPIFLVICIIIFYSFNRFVDKIVDEELELLTRILNC